MYRLGSDVVVKEPGFTYTTYENWAGRYYLKKWAKGYEPHRGESHRIVKIAPHTTVGTRELFAVQNSAGEQFIVDQRAFGATLND